MFSHGACPERYRKGEADGERYRKAFWTNGERHRKAF